MRLRIVGTIAVLTLAMTACATAQEVSTEPNSTESVDAQEQSSKTGDASSRESFQKQCADTGGVFGEPALLSDTFSVVEQWIEVDDVSEIDRNPDFLDSQLRLVGNSSGRKTSIDVFVEDRFAETIKHGLSAGTDVVVGVGTIIPGTFVTLVFLRDSDGFYVADRCGAWADQELSRELGGAAEVDKLVSSLSAIDQSDVSYELFFAEPDDVNVADAPIVLNPAEADAELLSSLDEALLVMSSDRWENPGIICSRTEGMWNDCVATELLEASPDGVDLDIYVASSGVLELWYLGPTASLSEPETLLGKISIDPQELSASALTAVRVEIVATNTRASGSIQVLEIADFNDVLRELESDLQSADQSGNWAVLQELIADKDR